MQLSFTLSSVLGGATSGLLIGAAYGWLQAPRASDRGHDAQHFALIGATVGSVAAALWARPAPALTVASNP